MDLRAGLRALLRETPWGYNMGEMSPRLPRRSPAPRVRAMTLIEVMVAMSLLAMGLLGLVVVSRRLSKLLLH